MVGEISEGPRRGAWARTAAPEAPEQSPTRSIFARPGAACQAAGPSQDRYDRAATIWTGTQDGDAVRLIQMRMARDWAWEQSAETEARWQSRRVQAVPEWQTWPWQAVVIGITLVALFWLGVLLPQTAALGAGR